MHVELPSGTSRRDLLKTAGCGFGSLGLLSLLADEGLAFNDETDPLAPKKPHFSGKAKSVIWLFMNGGPSQVDTWDYKPELEKRDGVELDGFDRNTGFFANAVGPLMKSPFKFTPRGECGKMVSSLFPKLGEHVDKMAFIHSGYTESNNHSPALFMMNSGQPRMGLPCIGSWVTYGLGSESRDLPAFRRDVRPAQSRPSQRPLGQLGSRVPAERLPGDVAEAAGRPDRQPETPTPHDRQPATAAVGPAAEVESSAQQPECWRP